MVEILDLIEGERGQPNGRIALLCLGLPLHLYFIVGRGRGHLGKGGSPQGGALGFTLLVGAP